MTTKVVMIAYTNYPVDARVRREAEALVNDANYQVSVLTLKRNFLPRTYVSNGVLVKELNLKKYRGKSPLRYMWSYLRFTLLSWLECTRLFLKNELDIVHIHNMPNFLVFSAIVPRLFGKKLILDIHDSVPETFLSKFNGSSNFLFNFFCLEERISSALAHRIICVNEVQRNVLVKRGIPEEKTSISMNIPDDRLFISDRIPHFEPDSNGRFKIVYHGTITHRLGVDLAIQSVSQLVDKIPKLEFHIWGAGEFLEHCVSLSGTLGLNDKVHFHGTVDFTSIPEVLKDMDLGVVPNRRSNATDMMLPLKMLEYIALGIPVVAARLETVEYYFSDGMVSYFEPDDVQSLVSAIYSNYKEKTKSRERAEKSLNFLKKYSWAEHKNELFNLYSKLSK